MRRWTRRTAPGHLTPDEITVLTQMARGHDQNATAARLGMTASAVKSTLQRARRTVGATSMAHLVAVAIRTGQLPADVAAGSEVTR